MSPVAYFELDATTVYALGGGTVVPCAQTGTIISSTSQPC
jgi:hypothetical protein